MTYFLIAGFLLVATLAYFKLADLFNIIDKPNQRSSHSTITIRGGGVIFPVAVLLWFIFFKFPYPWFMAGLLLIAGISFLDDIYTLSTKPRLAVHLVSVALMLQELALFSVAWYWWVLAFILIIGWLNAFNFMDGINGITVFYALSVITPIWFLNQDLALVQNSLLYVIGISLLVFAWFNARKRARTFAGDVGSVSMAFILAFLMFKLIIHTHHWEYILFFAIYGVDAVLTIIHRLIRGENIFKAHRSHLYQYLANEAGWPHVLVAGIYAGLQLLISFLVITYANLSISIWLSLSVLIVLSLLYIASKAHILRRLNAVSAKA